MTMIIVGLATLLLLLMGSVQAQAQSHEQSDTPRSAIGRPMDATGSATMLPVFGNGAPAGAVSKAACAEPHQKWPDCEYDARKTPGRSGPGDAAIERSPRMAAGARTQDGGAEPAVRTPQKEKLQRIETESYNKQRVFGCTNANDNGVGSPVPGLRFGPQPDTQNRARCFLAEVTVPSSHTAGVIERPLGLLGFKLSENPNRHIVMSAISRIATMPESGADKDDARMTEWLAQAVAQSDGQLRRRAILVITGVGGTLESTVHRAGQVLVDSNLSGVPFVCAWNSPAITFNPASYLRARNAAEQALPMCSRMIDLLLDTSFHEVVVIGYSAGAHILMQALAPRIRAAAGPDPRTVDLRGALKLEKPDPKVQQALRKLKHIVLVAPDVDRTVFIDQILKPLGRIATRPMVTLYASGNDRWIRDARIPWGNERLGRGGQADILIYPGMVSIDTTDKVATDRGHNLLGLHEIMRDLQHLIEAGLEPDSKTRWLERRTRGTGEVYYRLK